MRVLITGVAGFVAGHLVDFLRAEQPRAQIVGLDARPGNRVTAMGIDIVQADIERPDSLRRALAEVRPDRIVHLAAQSSPQQSWDDPEGTLRVNVLGLLHLLEAVRRLKLSPFVLVVGSAEEYGLLDPKQVPVREETPLNPVSPYAVSKVAQGFLALQYALSWRLPVIRTRTFNHTGPRRGAGFAESSFARQLAEIEAGQRPPRIEVGNLDAIRDFTDVRDVVRAYWALLESGSPGEVYNVCSGRGVKMRAILDELIALSGARVEVCVDPARLRPSDVPVLIGDHAKLRAATGWEPRVAISTTLRDLLDHWRERVRAPTSPTPGGVPRT